MLVNKLVNMVTYDKIKSKATQYMIDQIVQTVKQYCRIVFLLGCFFTVFTQHFNNFTITNKLRNTHE